MATNGTDSQQVDNMRTSSSNSVEAAVASRRKIENKPPPKIVKSEIPRER